MDEVEVPDPELPPYDEAILVWWDNDNARPVFNIGKMDPDAAVNLLRRVAMRIEDDLALPIEQEERGEDDGD